MTEHQPSSNSNNEAPSVDEDAEWSSERAQQLDEHLITDDTEILGESLHMRRSLSTGTREVTTKLQEAYVGTRGVTMKPRQKYLELFRARNELKVQRLKEKIASDPDAPHLKRDKEWLAMYEARQGHWQNKLNKHTSKHEARGVKLGAKTEARHEKYQQRIDTYIHKRIDAVRKKEYRRIQQEQNIGRFNFREQVEFFRRLPDAEKQRITRDAILAVRDKNINKGKLGVDYMVEPGEVRRSIDNYERSVR